MRQYDIKRGDAIIATVKPKGSINEAIMGESGVSMSFELPRYIAFHTSDTVEVDGIQYILNTEPTESKISKKRYRYELNFQGFKFELDKTTYCTIGNDNTLKDVEFSLMANALGFIELIVKNLNREHSGWAVGLVDETEYVNLNFNEQSCLSVIADLAIQFKTEYWIVGKTIHLTKRGEHSGLTFEYGPRKGLYGLVRTQPSDKKHFTRIIARGGTENIPADYRGGSSRLQLPAGLDFLERNVDKYGVIECPRTYDEIYPRRLCTVTSVGDIFSFTDSSMDFDVNAQRIPNSDTLGKITFNTGQLSGYQFDLVGYNNAAKTFKIAVHKEEKALTVPSDLLRPAIGDKFVIKGIIMPDADILNAELEVQAKAQEDLNQNSDPWATYTLTPDLLDFKRRGVVLSVGTYVHVADTDMGVALDIRLISYKKDLQDYFKYTEPVLATTVAIADIVKQYAQLEQVDKAVRINKLSDAARARRNYKTTEELKGMIFDTDGYFTDKIRPLSIETTMLTTGAKSQQFVLNGILISANYQGSQAKFRSTAGSLDHFSLFDTIRSWSIAPYSNDELVSTTAYYIYAKCSKGGSGGAILLSTLQFTVDQDANDYHFLMGVLSSAIDGVRIPQLTYGSSTFNGRFIKSGNIESNNGLTYFDLDAGEIGGKIIFKAGSSGYSNLLDKPDLSGITDAQTAANAAALAANAAAAAAANALNAAAADATQKANAAQAAAIASANATAIGIAQSKADVAQAAAILAASAVAQAKADAAYNASLSAAQTYASTVAANAGNTAVIAAAADALNKANTAYNNAVAAATAQYNGFAATLGALAFRNAVEVAQLGETIISGGYINTVLIKVAELYVRNIKTDDTGKRIEITGDQNNMKFFDNNGSEVIRFDDDIIISSVHITPRPYPESPIITYTYGPGIRVGATSGRRTETGPNGFRMYDDNGDLTSGFFPGEVRLDAYTSLYVRDGGLQWAKGWSGILTYKDGSNLNRNALYVSGILINPNI